MHMIRSHLPDLVRDHVRDHVPDLVCDFVRGAPDPACTKLALIEKREQEDLR